jgi:AcrR family transcriptional regulator
MENEKTEILKKIAYLFFKYGIKSVSMDDIAKELAISKKTLYVFFKDKHEVVEKVMEQHNNCCQNYLKCKLEDANNAIEEYFELILMVKNIIEERNPSFDYDLKKYYPDLYNKHDQVAKESMTAFFIENLNKGKEEGSYRNDFSSDILTKFHVSTITTIHLAGIFSMSELFSYEIYRQYFIFFIRGVASPKGVKLLEEKIEEYGFNNTQTR